MTLPEAQQIASSLESSATSKDLELLVELTQGFPIPLTYAIRLSARRGTSIAGIMDGTRTFTFDFLAEQLWVSLPTQERALLEIAAFLPPTRLHDYEIAGHRGASHFIARICDDIAFLSVSATGTFSMHDLFRDFVRLQVSLAGPSVQRERYNSAVKVLFEGRRYNEAFSLLMEAGNLGDLSEAVEIFWTCITDLSLVHRIVDATEHIPPAKLGLGALYLQTEYWSSFDHPYKSRLFAEEIIRRRDAPSKHLLCALRSVSRAIDAQDVAEQNDLLARMPEIIARLDDVDCVQAHACQASILARFPESHKETRSLLRQVQKKMGILDAPAQINAQMAIASASFFLGETSAALAATREAVAVAKSVNDVREIARTLNNLGVLLMLEYDSEVESIFQPLREAIEKAGSWRFSHVSHWYQAGYYASKGDIRAALFACELQLAVITSGASQQSHLKGVQRYSRDLCHLINEDFQAILSDFEKSGLPKQIDLAYELMVIVAAAHAFNSNLVQSDSLLKQARALHNSLPAHLVNLVHEALYIEIVTMCAIGQWSQARRLHDKHRIDKANLRSPSDLISRFCQGPPFAALGEKLEQCLEKPYVGLIALLVKRVVESAQYRPELPLSGAEIDVLRLLALGNSNKDIASTRSRSAQTVKRQISSVYRKLGVDNRTSAVAIARERGLL